MFPFLQNPIREYLVPSTLLRTYPWIAVEMRTLFYLISTRHMFGQGQHSACHYVYLAWGRQRVYAISTIFGHGELDTFST